MEVAASAVAEAPPAPSAAAAAAPPSTPVKAAANATNTTASALRTPRPDREIPSRDTYTIVEDYITTLNQTNIDGGRNNNKYYIINLLQNERTGQYSVWTRWGRVGEPGQNKMEPCGSFEEARRVFESKFRDKTKNAWSNRDNFVKHDGKYQLLDMEHSAGGGDDNDDTPLGRLSKSQVEKGQAVLADLRKVLEGTASGNSVTELSARYYTLIPTVVGRQVAPPINTLQALEEKEELLKFYLRMGFEEVDSAEAALTPIDGVMALPLPSSLREAAGNVTQSGSIASSENKGKELAKSQVGKPVRPMEGHLYASVLLYTSNAIYTELNRVLREEKRASVKRYFKYLRLFLEALGTLPSKPSTVWRGVSVDLSSTYKVGTKVTWWGVSSTTSDENVARVFMRGCGQGTLFTIKAKTACDISCITFYSNEKESLLAPGTELLVLASKKNGSITEIELEEVGRAFQ